MKSTIRVIAVSLFVVSMVLPLTRPQTGRHRMSDKEMSCLVGGKQSCAQQAQGAYDSCMGDIANISWGEVLYKASGCLTYAGSVWLSCEIASLIDWLF